MLRLTTTQEAEARPAPVEEDIAAAPPSEQEQLEAQLLDQMIHPRKYDSAVHCAAPRAQRASCCPIFPVSVSILDSLAV